MKDVLKTADPVKLSFARAVLRDAGIESFVLDEGMASMYGGGIEFVKKRLSVIDEEADRARQLIDDALAESE
ncbi:MAG: hypothetical protein CMF76_11440 [Maricaulis sp.]|uniref:DUF2007 domain-containing protein n=1 Tax=Maricaulis virginensis TaxID=144022 RepID=A0A9W6IRA7_9PROT|nr:DUF2007 domain-containing protein [Maricaulis virginensis]MAZ92557.1 hypothetical protein [Maricaulis sp.]GLK53790.1 hypothetical protein GCM10017621_32980 [Maricaulis virginensis]